MGYLDFLDLSVSSWLLVGVALILAGLTKGTIGVGMPILAVPLLAFFMDLPAIVTLLSVPGAVTNIPQIIGGDRLSKVFRRMWPIFAGLVIGTAVGVYLLTSINIQILRLLGGGILVMVAVTLVVTQKMAIPPYIERYTSPVVGLIGGVAGGVASMSGPFVFGYLLGINLTRDQFVQYSSLFLLVSNGLVVAFLWWSGALRGPQMIVSCAATIPIFIAMWAGAHARAFVSPIWFRRAIAGVVLVGGLRLMVVAS
jgi:uncharacterized membrane protein YfcA